MRITRVVLICSIVAGLAAAQSFEGSVSGGPSILSSSDLGSGYSLDNGFNLGFRMTLNTQQHLGYELGYIYNRTHLLASGFDQGGMAVHQGFGDVLFYPNRSSERRVRPFLAGGLNFDNFVAPGQTAQYGQGQTKFGFDYGAGVKMKVTGPWNIRFDFRQFNVGKPFDLGGSGRLLINEISAGVAFAL